MEAKLESRVEILDRLAKKFANKNYIETFSDFCTYFNPDAITQLVRIAMQEYELQTIKSMKSKLQVKKLIERYDLDLKNSTAHYQLPRKFTVEEWCGENI